MRYLLLIPMLLLATWSMAQQIKLRKAKGPQTIVILNHGYSIFLNLDDVHAAANVLLADEAAHSEIWRRALLPGL